MADYRQPNSSAQVFRKTRRLTFQSSDGQIALISQERLDMICPPSVGEPPVAGHHGGFWVELRDAKNDVKFFRVLDDPMRDSVEIHSPDGKIRREFGPPQDSIFEVLVPDETGAETLVLMGERQEPRTGAVAGRKQAAGASEIARFDLSGSPKGARS